MKNKKNYREEFIKNFFKKISPDLKENFEQKKLGSYCGNNKPIIKLGQVIAEIETSIDYLKLLPNLFMNHSSYYEKKGFSRVKQHRKKIENYLSEVYILKERVIRMLTLLKKYFIKKKLSKKSEEILLIDSLKKKFIDSLDNLLEVRGDHVHKYSYQDENLYHLELLEISIQNFDYSKEQKEFLSKDFLFFLKQDRKYWNEKVQKDINRLLEQLDIIYSKIDDFIIKM